MTSLTPSPPEDFSPLEAVSRLQTLCDELELRQVPLHQVEEVRALSGRFHRHIEGLSAFWEILESYASKQRALWC